MSSGTSDLSHLQQGPTARRPTYRLVQMLRAAAAILVVLHHSTNAISDRLGIPNHNYSWVFGASGVDIFFVISGFVMAISTAPLLRSPHAARTFLARRLERIVPLYWLLTVLKIVLVKAMPSASLNGIGGVAHVVSSFLFLPPISGFSVAMPLLIVGWTLNLEMGFYALFALALWWRRPPLAVVAPALIGIVLLARVIPGSQVFAFYGNPIVLEFLFGILLAKALPWLKHVPAWLALGAGVVAFWPMLFSNQIASATRVWVWGLPALVIVAAALVLEPLLGSQSPRWGLELGDASYSIYLFHGFVLTAVAEWLAHLGKFSYAGGLALMLVLSVLGSEVVYRLVERPIMQWFKGRRKTAVPVNA